MCGGGGGDGGYQDRQDQMKAEQDAAIDQINQIFGKGSGVPIYGSNTSTPTGGSPTGTSYSDGVHPPIVGSRAGAPSVDPYAALTNPAPGDDGGVYQTASGFHSPTSGTPNPIGWDTKTRDANLSAREKLYGTISSDAEARLMDKLGQDRTHAEREERFQLARQGLGGGSADVDAGAELLRHFQEGSLEARNSADSTANSARSADETTRVNLINNIRNGMAQSDAISAAYSGMSNNANTARDAALQTNIGSFFDDLSLLNNQVRYQQGLQTTLKGGGGGSYGSATTGSFNGRIGS